MKQQLDGSAWRSIFGLTMDYWLKNKLHYQSCVGECCKKSHKKSHFCLQPQLS